MKKRRHISQYKFLLKYFHRQNFLAVLKKKTGLWLKSLKSVSFWNTLSLKRLPLFRSKRRRFSRPKVEEPLSFLTEKVASYWKVGVGAFLIFLIFLTVFSLTVESPQSNKPLVPREETSSFWEKLSPKKLFEKILFSQSPSDQNTEAKKNSKIKHIPPKRTPPAGWREYQSKKYYFSVFYPEGLTVQEYDEGGGAGSITFENADHTQGFQVFVVPYEADHVTAERFKMDAPSGVKEDSVNVLIDGVQGTRFISENGIMGETQEVWFLNYGYLYEVVTYQAQSAWLGQVMQTWKFF